MMTVLKSPFSVTEILIRITSFHGEKSGLELAEFRLLERGLSV